MSGIIPEDKIAEVQNSVDIVDVVSEHVLLKKAGRNHLGLCPFHTEKTPSFTVSQEKQVYYCFGCQAGGNVFNFLMKRDGLGFVEAVKLLARRAGIEIADRQMSPEMKRRLQERERIFAVNKAALGFFRRNLESPGGQAAKRYLEKRGLDQETIEAFQIGFAPRGWDNLLGFFSRRKEKPETVEKAGLIARRPSGNGYYDRFRERVVFPIVNVGKQVAGFGGRVMDNSLPKYLNSPETPVFNKRKCLYGLDLTRAACREEGAVFIVEGYLDLIALYQHGVKNVAATLGTSLTPDHVQLLKKTVKKVFLVFDGDEAGKKAALRSIPLFREQDVDTRVMALPKGHDPDSFVFEFGGEAFLEEAEKAPGAMAFQTETAIGRHGLSVEGKLAVLEDMKGPLNGVRDPAARSLYARELAARLDIDEDAVLESVRMASSKTGKPFSHSGPGRESPPETYDAPPGLLEEPPGFLDCPADFFEAPPEMCEPPRPDSAPPMARTMRGSGPERKTERKIVSMMLLCPETLADIVNYDVLDYFEDEDLKAVAQAVLLHFDGDGSGRTDISELSSCLENETQRRLAVALAKEDEDSWMERGGRKRQLILQFIEAGRLRNEKKLLEKIKDAEANNDMELLLKLLARQHRSALAGQETRAALLKNASSMNNLEQGT